MIELNKIYKEDCLEYMDKLIEQGVIVDAIITDLPYGTTACKWDTTIPFDAMWKRLNKLIKPNGAIVLFGSQPFTSLLVTSNIDAFKYEWIWNKERGTNFLNFKYQPAKAHENILVFGYAPTSYTKKGENLSYFPQMEKGEPYTQKQGRAGDAIARDEKTRNNCVVTENDGTRYPKSYQFFNTERGLHPTQKPVALMEYLIKTYTNENEIVLDFTCGSGSTLVACKNTQRKFYACELDAEYVAIANKRLEQAQGSLF